MRNDEWKQKDPTNLAKQNDGSIEYIDRLERELMPTFLLISDMMIAYSETPLDTFEKRCKGYKT